eukprot:11222174-Lingulodinium_polyedra.AAC.1
MADAAGGNRAPSGPPAALHRADDGRRGGQQTRPVKPTSRRGFASSVLLLSQPACILRGQATAIQSDPAPHRPTQ